MKTIEVSNCHECPFANNDNEWGHDSCNLEYLNNFPEIELPEDTVHKKCPLKKQNYIIKLK